MEYFRFCALGRRVRMRILWVMKKQFDVAGNSSARIEMIKQLERLGHSVIFLTGYRRHKETYGIDNIHFVPTIRYAYCFQATFDLSLAVLLPVYILRWNPDVVIMDPTTFVSPLVLCLFRKIRSARMRTILDIRTIPVETVGFSGWLNCLLFGISMQYARFLYDGVTTITPYMSKHLKTKYKLNHNKTGIWASGASLEHFDPSSINLEKRNDLKKRLGLEGKFIALYHGSISAHRGLNKVIEAVRLLREHPSIVLLVVGWGSYLDELRHLVQQADLEERVAIHGSVSYDEIPYFIDIADVGVIPLPDLIWWRVSSPLKLMEYMAMEKIVIVSDIEAHRYVLQSAPCAFYFEPNNPEHMASRLLEVFSLTQAKRVSLGKIARQLVDEFTWEKQAHRLDAYIRSLRISND